MSSEPFTNPFSTGAGTGARHRPVLDLSTVAVVLYVAPFTPADWRLLGTEFLAGYVAAVAAEPQFRVPEMVALVLASERVGRLGLPDHWRAARRHARRVLAVWSN